MAELGIQGFASAQIPTGETTIFTCFGGSGPPLLLLHGFPQTHLMWRDIARELSDRFTVVCADLRGYGRSGCPPTDGDHAPYSKRAMAADMVAVMAHLGFGSFSVAGHDRGGRVAYRMALDHAGAVSRLAALDVLPNSVMWDRADARLAIAFWPWSLLAQPAPLPERLIAADPAAVVDDALSQWGTPRAIFPAEVRNAYVEALKDPEHINAICEEYRAAADVDRRHDQQDRDSGRRIRCPLLALWAEKGGLNEWYEAEGGPLALWREWADDVAGEAVPGGHFFPEEQPLRVANLLARFFSGDSIAQAAEDV